MAKAVLISMGPRDRVRGRRSCWRRAAALRFRRWSAWTTWPSALRRDPSLAALFADVREECVAARPGLARPARCWRSRACVCRRTWRG